MEGEKETAEEKEEEEEENLPPQSVAASSVDYQDLPIMHWEDLSLRIAELEKQEQERRERSKVRLENTQHTAEVEGLIPDEKKYLPLYFCKLSHVGFQKINR